MSVVEAGGHTFKEPVFVLTISKLEPECVNYHWSIEQRFENGKPELLEQLVLALNVIENAKHECEQAALNNYIQISRNVRREMVKERETKAETPPPDVVH